MLRLPRDQDRRHAPPLGRQDYPVEIYYRDYKTVRGLMIPYVMETKVHGVKQPEKIEVENVAVNPWVEDSRFAKLQ